MERENRVLVVDDDELVLSFMEELLSSDYSLRTASSGEEALKIIPRFKPDIILLDIVMPGIDGYEVCKRIRGDKNLNHITVFFLSARISLKEKLQGYNVGGDDYITKPFEEDEILAKIKVFIRIKEEEERPGAEDIKIEEKMLEVLYRVQHDLPNIFYIKSASPYCRVISKSISDASYKIRITIQALEDYFKGKSLLRVHRSYLVNPKRILSINKQKNSVLKILLKDKRGEIAMVPVGRSYHDKIQEAIPKLFPS